ncbi:MAG TPA: ParB/RepB/Spo0J family partition protein [Candidatus Limnocylindrales bacterium]|jgi:ParB family chromosome partitioning protein
MSAIERKNGGLGRGLASLIPPRPPGAAPADVPVDRVRRNPYQPRSSADASGLEALAESIRMHGVLQPILVVATFDGYQLIAGERRLRAAELAGLTRIPAIVRDAAEQDQLELALIENLQRSDLDPIDEARAYRRLMDEFGLDQEAVARRVGRARSSIANAVRLLDLAEPVQHAVASGQISEGHARAIAGLPETSRQLTVLDAVISGGLSVRQTEELVRRLKELPEANPSEPAGRDPDMERLEADLREALGTKVTVTSKRRGGRITIEFYDHDDLERLTTRLTGGGA